MAREPVLALALTQLSPSIDELGEFCLGRYQNLSRVISGEAFEIYEFGALQAASHKNGSVKELKNKSLFLETNSWFEVFNRL